MRTIAARWHGYKTDVLDKMPPLDPAMLKRMELIFYVSAGSQAQEILKMTTNAHIVGYCLDMCQEVERYFDEWINNKIGR